MLELGVIGDEHFGGAELGRFVGGRADAFAGDEQRQRAARLLGHLLAERDRRQGSGAQLSVVRFDDYEDVAHQITFASLWSFCTSSSTEATLTPALRAGGASSAIVLTFFAVVTPSAAKVVSSIGFFFAAMMPFSDA